MNINTSEWLQMTRLDRYILIWRAYVKCNGGEIHGEQERTS